MMHPLAQEQIVLLNYFNHFVPLMRHWDYSSFKQWYDPIAEDNKPLNNGIEISFWYQPGDAITTN